MVLCLLCCASGLDQILLLFYDNNLVVGWFVGLFEFKISVLSSAQLIGHCAVVEKFVNVSLHLCYLDLQILGTTLLGDEVGYKLE